MNLDTITAIAAEVLGHVENDNPFGDLYKQGIVDLVTRLTHPDALDPGSDEWKDMVTTMIDNQRDDS